MIPTPLREKLEKGLTDVGGIREEIVSLVDVVDRGNSLAELEALDRTIARLREEIPGDRTKREAEIVRLEQIGARIRRDLWPNPDNVDDGEEPTDGATR